MNQNAVELVQESWSRVEAVGPAAVALFQRQLREQRPWLTAPYQGLVDDRDAMLLRTFGHALGGMHSLDSHSALLMQIGRVNACCGVQAHHYPCFEVALFQTLAQVLGGDFSPPLKAAWTATIGTMTRLMLAGASGEPLAAIALRQHATDRRLRHRRAAHELGGNRGQHRRSAQAGNRRTHHAHVNHRAVRLAD